MQLSKIQEGSSRALCSLLISALHSCRKGSLDVVSELGLERDFINSLDCLKSDQIPGVCDRYMSKTNGLQIYNIDSEILKPLLDQAANGLLTEEQSCDYPVLTKLQEGSSRALCSLLLSVLHSCRSGKLAVSRELALEVDTIRVLDRLKPDQIPLVCDCYIRMSNGLQIFSLESDAIKFFVDRAVEDSHHILLTDEYLELGASKKIMAEIFGWRSTQVSYRKRILDIKTDAPGRFVVSVDEERLIYNSWLSHLKVGDVRDRYLLVAKETMLPMTKVYRVVEEMNEIQKTLNNNRICA